jgi:hypothetical protein
MLIEFKIASLSREAFSWTQAGTAEPVSTSEDRLQKEHWACGNAPLALFGVACVIIPEQICDDELNLVCAVASSSDCKLWDGSTVVTSAKIKVKYRVSPFVHIVMVHDACTAPFPVCFCWRLCNSVPFGLNTEGVITTFTTKLCVLELIRAVGPFDRASQLGKEQTCLSLGSMGLLLWLARCFPWRQSDV